MAAVPQKGTSIELVVREILTSVDIKFKVNVSTLPGRPDIFLAKQQIPIFIHGCFWHRHTGCKLTTTPKRNRAFWTDKFEKTVARDKKVIDDLQDQGYEPIVIWQCETRDKEVLESALMSLTKGASWQLS